MSLLFEPEVSAPYPGLRPFRRDEAQVFFGRDAQVDDILRRLKQNHFLGVVGSSGFGKSSLVRAGLLPSLESGLMGEIGSTWYVADMKPGDSPLTNLAEALVASGVLAARVSDSPQSIALLTAELRRSDVSLANMIRQVRLPKYSNLLVLADQFEEIFRFHQRDPNEALAFVSLLLTTVRDTSIPVYVVLTMRSDFLGPCAVFPGLPEALNDGQFLCPRLTRQQLAEAIEGPANVFGATVEPSLVMQLMNDAGTNSDQLPLVQHVLARIWNQYVSATDDRSDITLKRTLYIESGGLCGRTEVEAAVAEASLRSPPQFHSWQNALSRHADEAYFELADSTQPASRLDGPLHEPSRRQRVAEMLFRSLAGRSINGQYVRHPVKIRDVAEIVQEAEEPIAAAVDRIIDVVNVFRHPDRSFLVPPADVTLTPDSVVDISHEALIRQWQRLAGPPVPPSGDSERADTAGWLAAESEARQRYRRLAEAAEMQSTSGLMKDPELGFLHKWWEQFQPRRAWANRCVANSFHQTKHYLHSSLTAAKQEADQEKRAAAHLLQLERDKVLATQRLLKIAGAIATVAAVLAVVAWRLQQVATAAKDRADQTTRDLRHEKEKVEASEKLVTAEKNRAERLLEQSERLLYASQVRTAEQALADGNIPLCLQFLDACRWDFRNWEHDYLTPHYAVFRGHGNAVASVAFSPDGQRIVSGSIDNTLKLWDAPRKRAMLPIQVTSGEVKRVAAIADAKWIVSGDSRDRVQVWSAVTGRFALELPGHKSTIMALACRREDKHIQIASGSSDETIRFWQLTEDDTGKNLIPDGSTEFRLADNETPWCMAYSSDGAWLAAGTSSGQVRIFDAATRTQKHVIVAHPSYVKGLQFDAGNQQLITAGLTADKNSEIKVWDVNTGKLVRLVTTIAGHWTAGFAKHDNLIASGSDKGQLRIWDFNTSRQLATVGNAHKKDIHGIVFSPDGSLLATGSWDHTINVWKVRSTDEGVSLVRARTLNEHENPVNSLTFSHNGTRLVSGSNDGTVRVWLLKELLPLHFQTERQQKTDSAATSSAPPLSDPASPDSTPMDVAAASTQPRTDSVEPPSAVMLLLVGLVVYVVAISLTASRRRSRAQP